MTPRPSEIRHRVDPADVTSAKAARRLSLTETRFQELLPELIKRGFPAPDPTTGMYDLDAIDLWRRSRHPRLYGLTPIASSAEPKQAAGAGMGERFRATKERRGNDSAA